jgi:cysteine sulfinate desulfinase/cysteine desulfurase-like protein
MFGGGHERGLRSGTLAVHQIVGFGVACELAAAAWAGDAEHCERCARVCGRDCRRSMARCSTAIRRSAWPES